ncbi:PREDICTED: uncharacterized protein LOC102852970 [Elephantulus edwardii]|uniref:uncharacterized protein LOC102852970 n=1 Tax=Elephantulus edwardii TaxID=28737 RepID=UPI0003F07E24|nr:PREDICTED: uncharacterized protein LOC102852970 [Elephantulus edwardii]
MEAEVDKLELMFQKADSDLDCILYRLEYEIKNNHPDSAGKKNPVTLLKELSAIKSRYQTLHARFKPLADEQKEMLAPIHKVTRKKIAFEWGPEQQQAMAEIQKAVSLSLPLVPYDPHFDMTLKGSATYACAAAAYEKKPRKAACRTSYLGNGGRHPQYPRTSRTHWSYPGSPEEAMLQFQVQGMQLSKVIPEQTTVTLPLNAYARIIKSIMEWIVPSSHLEKAGLPENITVQLRRPAGGVPV